MKYSLVCSVLSHYYLVSTLIGAVTTEGEAPDVTTTESFKSDPFDYQAQETIHQATTPGPRTFMIAELVGLSTLKGFALLTFPLLIPIVVLALAILILPLPILSAPIAFGRRLGDTTEVDDVLTEILQSTNCMERFSCEVGRSIKTPQVRTIVDQSFTELGSQLEGKWKNSYYGYVLGSSYKSSSTNICLKFKCKLSKNPL